MCAAPLCLLREGLSFKSIRGVKPVHFSSEKGLMPRWWAESPPSRDACSRPLQTHPTPHTPESDAPDSSGASRESRVLLPLTTRVAWRRVFMRRWLPIVERDRSWQNQKNLGRRWYKWVPVGCVQ